MSAKAWDRRRRLKYLRPVLNYVARHPNRIIVCDRMAIMGMAAATLTRNVDRENMPDWRVLPGLYRGRFEIHEVTAPQAQP